MIKKIHDYLDYKKSIRKILPDFTKFLELESRTKKRFALTKQDISANFQDNSDNTAFDRHYIYHPAWAARILKETNPALHIDISSTLHFCTIVSAFIPVDFYDYRPANVSLSNLSSQFQDLCQLSFKDNSVTSLSCMHTVEHVGLGRYGDPLNYDGDLTAMKELARVLKPGGNLLFVVPVGNEPKIAFNGHRIYSKAQIDQYMSDFGLRSKEFHLIPELESDGGLVLNPDNELLEKQSYGCGCFWFTKDTKENE